MSIYNHDNTDIQDIEINLLLQAVHLKYGYDFFIRLWSEFSFSPYILIAFLGILLLILFDKIIIKYLYTI